MDKRNARGGLIANPLQIDAMYPPDGGPNWRACFSTICTRQNWAEERRCDGCRYNGVTPFYYVYAGPWVEWARGRVGSPPLAYDDSLKPLA